MSQVRVFLDIQNTKLLKGLQPLFALKQVQVEYASEEGEGLFQLQHTSADIALIEVDNFSKADLARLAEVSLATETEIVFFSDGKPNAMLDKAMLNGVIYHFRPDYDFEHINETLSEVVSEFETVHKSKVPANQSALDQFGLLLGSSKPMRKLYRTIRKVAATDANVFVIGESGTGKELVANTIHLVSERSEKPFIAVNCGALSPELVESELFGHTKGAFTGASRDHKGVFEQAHGGTLFLDEITEMPLDHQVKLLRVLETGEYRAVGSDKLVKCDVRVVAATNRNVDEAIDTHIREDLYFRLAQFPIQLPPLKERGDDAVGLAQHFLSYRNMENKCAKAFMPATIELLKGHEWPGNVRELKHVIERAFILAENEITPEHVVFDDVSSSDDISEGEG
ncbi:MAG: sigma-54 dependent transcriptional regulator, partial [Glaciecola sp.]|nr:sigma-54 dependent transcriptional regulator [Glaciecola sp.]